MQRKMDQLPTMRKGAATMMTRTSKLPDKQSRCFLAEVLHPRGIKVTDYESFGELEILQKNISFDLLVAKKFLGKAFIELDESEVMNVFKT